MMRKTSTRGRVAEEFARSAAERLPEMEKRCEGLVGTASE
jgi:hypothetical protein